MVAIVAGNGLGLFNTSLNHPGAIGMTGHGGLAQSGGRSYVNAVTGNLVLRAQDEQLSGRGSDLLQLRTYNSQGTLSDGDADGWRWDAESTVQFSGPADERNLSGTVTRVTGDGHLTVYRFVSASVGYTSQEGDGAHDSVKFISGEWVWTDGSTRLEEHYENSVSGGVGKLLSRKDISGNIISYGYTNGLLTDMVDNSAITGTGVGSKQRMKLTYVSGKLSKVETFELTTDSSGRATGTLGTAVRQVDYGYTNGLLTSVTTDLFNGKLFKTVYTYDGTSSRVASITSGDGSVTATGTTFGSRVGFTYEQKPGSNPPIFRVTKVTDANHGEQVFDYDDANNRIDVTLDGKTWTYTYDTTAGNQLRRIDSPAPTAGAPRLVTLFTYDTGSRLGDLLTVTDALDRVMTYTYDNRGNRSSEIDSAGNTVTRSFDSVHNQVLTETRYRTAAVGGAAATSPVTTRYVYDGSARLRFVVSPEGRVTERRYGTGLNDAGLLAQSLAYGDIRYPVAGLGDTTPLTETNLIDWIALETRDRKKTQIVQYEYDLRGNMSKSTEFSSANASGVGVLDAAATVTEYIYDGHGDLLKTIALRGSARDQKTDLTVVTYDGMRRELSRTDSSGTSTTVYSDVLAAGGEGSSIQVSTGSGLIATRSFDAMGRLTRLHQTEGAASRATQYVYDLSGRQVMVQDPAGGRRFNFYDAAGRLLYEVDTGGAVTGFAYDANGQVITRTQYQNRLDVDTADWVTETITDTTTSPAVTYTVTKTSLVLGTDFKANADHDRVTRNDYDAAGRLILQTDAGNVPTRTVYDGASRVVQQQTGDRVTRFFYDKDGKRTGTLDPLGYLTENKHDAAGRLIETVRYSTRSPGVSDAEAPVWVGVTDQTAPGGKPFSYRLQAFDADGDGLSYSLVGAAPAWLSLDTSVKDSPTLKGTPPAALTRYTVTVRADDGRGRTTDVGMTITVANSAPAWTDLAAMATSVNTAGFSLVLPPASDNESNPAQLTYAIDNTLLPPGLAFNANDRTISGTPTTAGTYLITVRVSDPQGRFTDKTFVLQVTGSGATWANAAPAPTATRTLPVSFTLPAALPAAPPAAQALTYSKISGPAWLSFSAATMTLSGTPPAGQALGPQPVVLQARDTQGGNVRLAFSVSVVDRAPTWKPALPAAQAVSGVAMRYAPPAAEDAEGAALIYTAVSGLPAGLSVNPASGAITGTSAAVGGFVVLLRATDSQGASVDSTVSLNLTPPVPAELHTPIDTVSNWRPASSTGDLHSHHYYDGQDREVGSVDERGFLSETVYNPLGNTRQDVRYMKSVTVGANDDLATLKEKAKQSGGKSETTTTTYDGFGRVSTITGVDGSVSHNVYDAAGRLVRQIMAENTSDQRAVRTRYNAFDEVTGAVRGEGDASLGTDPTVAQIDTAIAEYGTRYVYDKMGRVTKTVDAKPSGNAANEHATLRYYDREGRLSHSVNAAGEVSETVYDPLGQALTQRRYSTRLEGETNGPLLIALMNGSKGRSDLSEALAQMISEQDQTGVFTYDKRGQLITSKDALGRVSTNTYDSFGALSAQTRTIADGQVVTTQFGHDLYGQQVLQTRDAGGLNFSSRMAYDAFGRLVRSVDEAGAATKTDYSDDGGRTVEVTDPLGRMVQTAYDAFARVLTLTDARGQSTRYEYDNAQRKVILTLPASRPELAAIVVTTIKTAHGETLSVQDGRGNTTRYAYNKDGQLTTSTDALGRVASTHAYHKNGLLSRTTDARGVVTTYDYDAVNRTVERRVDPRDPVTNAAGLDLVSTYTFDAFGQNITTTEGTGDNQGSNVAQVTQYQYDLDGRQLQVIADPGGLALATTYTYDGLGNTVQVAQGTRTSPNLQVTQYVFDKLGRRVKEIAAPSAVFGAGSARTRDLTTEYRYDAAGRVSRAIDANGQSTWYVYDAAGQLGFTIDALGGVSRSLYDANGRLVQSVRYATLLSAATVAGFGDVVGTLTPPAARPGDQRSYFVPDNGGRQRYTLQAQDGSNWTISENIFDNNGNVTETRHYDKFLAQARIAAVDTIGSPGITQAEVSAELIALGYDNDVPTTLANVQRTRMAYDRNNRLRFTVDPLGSVTELMYDPAGNVVTSVRHAVRPTLPAATKSALTEAVIDAAVAPHRSNADNQVSRFARDKAGRLRYTVDPLGSVSEQAYDTVGRVVTSTRYAVRPALTGFDETTISTQLDHVDEAHPVSIRRNVNNRVTRSVHDRIGRLRFTLQSQLGTSVALSENRYDARGNVIETRRYDRFLEEAAIAAVDTAASPGITESEVAAQLTAMGYRDADERTLAAVQRTRFVYGAGNRLHFTIDALGSVDEQAYDAAGRVVANVRYAARPLLMVPGETVPSEATLSARVDRSDPANQVSHMAHDNVGRLCFRVQVLASDASGKATQQLLSEQRYDALGQMVERTAYATLLGVVTDYSAATLAAALTTSTADRRTGFAYDAVGQQVYSARALTDLQSGQTRHLVSQQSYDALGRAVKSTAYAAGLSLANYDKVTIDAAVNAEAIAGDVQNRISEFVYDTADQLRFVVAADGTFSETVYDVLGQVVEKRHFDQAVGAPTVTSALRSVASLIAARGNRAVGDGTTRGESYSYDTAGHLLGTTDAAGNADSNEYDGLGNRIAYFDKNGAKWEYTYDRLGRLRQQKAPPVLMQLSTDPAPIERAMRSLFTYDALGNLTTKQEATTTDDERVTRYAYDPLGRQVLLTLPGFYDPIRGQVFKNNLKDSGRFRRTLATSYDTLGNAVGTKLLTGANSYQYEYKTYDKLGRAVHDVDPLGHVTAFAYNAFGNQTSITRFSNSVGTAPPGGTDVAWTASAVAAALAVHGDDTLARSTAMAYDTLGRKTEATQSTVASYHEVRFISSAPPASAPPLSGAARTVYEYNNFGEVYHQAVKLDDSSSNADNSGRGGHWRDSWHYFDVMGRKTRSIDSVAVNADSREAYGYHTERAYDKLGNLEQVTEYANTNWSGTSGTFTPPPLPEKDHADRITRFTYDTLNRQTSTQRFGLSYYKLQDGLYILHNAQDVATTVQSLVYDKLGRVKTRIDDPGGLHNVTINEYDAVGNLRSVTEPARAVATAGSVDPFAGQVAVSPVTTFLYNGFGQAIQQVRSSGAGAGATLVTKTHYDAAGNITGITDANNNTKSRQVDFAGRLTKETQDVDVALGASAGGRMAHTLSRSYAYDATGRQTHTTVRFMDASVDTQTGQRKAYNAFGEVTDEYVVSGAADLAPERLASAYRLAHYTYDNAGQQSTKTAADGVTRYYYNLAGQVTRQEQQSSQAATDGSALRVTETEYDLLGRVRAQRLPVFTSTETPLSGDHSIRKTVHPLVIQSYDRWGNVLERTTGGTVFTNDQDGSGGQIFPSRSISYEYNADNKVIAEHLQAVTAYKTDKNSGYQAAVTHAMHYDALGRLVEEVDSVADDAATAANEADTDLRTRSRQYDAAGQLTSQTDATRNTTLYAYDGNGNRVGTRDAQGHVFTDAYDANGNLLSRSVLRQSDNHVAPYTGSGAPFAVRLSLYTYDQANRRVISAERTNYMPGPPGNDDGKYERTFTRYDERNFVRKTAFSRVSDKGTSTCDYDAFGNKTSETDRNGTTTTRRYSQQATDYSFGRLDAVDVGGHVTRYTYNGFGLLDKETYSVTNDFPGRTNEKRYAYHDNGLLKTTVYEDSWRVPGDADSSGQAFHETDTTGYEYTVFAEQASEHVHSTVVVEDPDNSMQVPNRTFDRTTRTSYDGMGRVMQVEVPQDALNVSYRYDELGNRREIESSIPDKAHRFFAYDDEGRMTIAEGIVSDNQIETGRSGTAITYDALGRRRTAETYIGLGDKHFVSTEPGDLEYQRWQLYRQEQYDYNDLGQLMLTKQRLNRREGENVKVRAPQGRDVITSLDDVEGCYLDSQTRHYDSFLGDVKLLEQYTDLHGESENGSTDVRAPTLAKTVESTFDSLTGFMTNQSITDQRGDKGHIVNLTTVEYHRDSVGLVQSYDNHRLIINEEVHRINDTYAYTYSVEASGLKEKSIALTSSSALVKTWNSYNTLGQLSHQLIRNPTDLINKRFFYDAQGHISSLDQSRYEFNSPDPSTEGQQNYFYARGQSVAMMGTGILEGTRVDSGYTPISASYPSASPSSYTVATDDTLASIARTVFGDGALWYLIADANGLSFGPDDRLVGPEVGRIYRIPNVVGNVHNNTSTFTPYDPAGIIGDSTPRALMPNPMDAQCISAKQLLIAAVVTAIAVVATVYTAGAASPLIGQAGALVAGAVAGSAAGQLTSIALTDQELGDFSGKQLFQAGVTSLATAGLGTAFAGTGVLDRALGAASTLVAQTAIESALTGELDAGSFLRSLGTEMAGAALSPAFASLDTTNFELGTRGLKPFIMDAFGFDGSYYSGDWNSLARQASGALSAVTASGLASLTILAARAASATYDNAHLAKVAPRAFAQGGGGGGGGPTAWPDPSSSSGANLPAVEPSSALSASAQARLNEGFELSDFNVAEVLRTHSFYTVSARDGSSEDVGGNATGFRSDGEWLARYNGKNGLNLRKGQVLLVPEYIPVLEAYQVQRAEFGREYAIELKNTIYKKNLTAMTDAIAAEISSGSAPRSYPPNYIPPYERQRILDRAEALRKHDILKKMEAQAYTKWVNESLKPIAWAYDVPLDRVINGDYKPPLTATANPFFQFPLMVRDMLGWDAIGGFREGRPLGEYGRGLSINWDINNGFNRTAYKTIALQVIASATALDATGVSAVAFASYSIGGVLDSAVQGNLTSDDWAELGVGLGFAGLGYGLNRFGATSFELPFSKSTPNVLPGRQTLPIDTVVHGGGNTTPMVSEGLSPASFGKITIAEDPILLNHWNEAMRSAANSSRSNGYTRYLESLGKGEVPTQKILEEAFGAVNSRFLPAARSSGFDFAEVHHWNFGKTDFPQGIVDSRSLVPVETRALHQEIHTATSSTSNIWGGTVAPQHQIILDGWFTKLPPRK